MKLLLIRHPAPDIAPGVCYGRLDIGLRADAAGAVRRIVAEARAHRPAAVWTSPARRCMAVAEALGPPPRPDARLLELDFGAWEGVAWDDVPRAALDAWAADPLGFAPPGGESGADLVRRVGEVARAILAAGRDAAVVSHGGPLRLLRALLRGAAPDPLAPAPALGSVDLVVVQPAATSDSTAHSVTTEAAPSTSPV